MQAGAREVTDHRRAGCGSNRSGNRHQSKPCGNMIVDIGGGTSDIAVISLGGTVVSASYQGCRR